MVVLFFHFWPGLHPGNVNCYGSSVTWHSHAGSGEGVTSSSSGSTAPQGLMTGQVPLPIHRPPSVTHFLFFFLTLLYTNYIFSCSNHICTIEFSELVAVLSFPLLNVSFLLFFFNVSFLHKITHSIQWRQMQQWEQEFCWWEWQVKHRGIILE